MNLDTARSGIKTKAYEHLHARMRNGKVNAVASLFSVVVLSKHGQVDDPSTFCADLDTESF